MRLPSLPHRVHVLAGEALRKKPGGEMQINVGDNTAWIHASCSWNNSFPVLWTEAAGMTFAGSWPRRFALPAQSSCPGQIKPASGGVPWHVERVVAAMLSSEALAKGR
jgi:hypothetical protein